MTCKAGRFGLDGSGRPAGVWSRCGYLMFGLAQASGGIYGYLMAPILLVKTWPMNVHAPSALSRCPTQVPFSSPASLVISGGYDEPAMLDAAGGSVGGPVAQSARAVAVLADDSVSDRWPPCDAGVMSMNSPGQTAFGANRQDPADAPVDVAHLLDARLWVARLGEADVLRWWRTDGILGADGAFVGPRVLPITHPTARARIAFAVARHACDERYRDPKAWHLFRLSPDLEDRLDALLVERLGDRRYWSGVMGKLEGVVASADPAEVLLANAIVGQDDLATARKADLGAGQRSLPIRVGATLNETIRRLAAGFVRSSPGNLVVPFVYGD